MLDEVKPAENEEQIKQADDLWEFKESNDIFSETQKHIKDLKYQKLIQKKLNRKRKKQSKLKNKVVVDKKITSLAFDFNPL